MLNCREIDVGYVVFVIIDILVLVVFWRVLFFWDLFMLKCGLCVINVFK